MWLVDMRAQLRQASVTEFGLTLKVRLESILKTWTWWLSLYLDILLLTWLTAIRVQIYAIVYLTDPIDLRYYLLQISVTQLRT